MSSRQAAFEFPRHLLPLLRCSQDAGELVCHEEQGGNVGVIEGTLCCSKCSEEYRIDNGIACLLKVAKTQEILHEMNLLDSQYKAMPVEFVALEYNWRSELYDAIEIPPNMQMLGPLNDRRVLEIACGDGSLSNILI
jgi:uncharacterized protein YbaR (Trm112 family)